MHNDTPNETNTKHSGRKYLYSYFMRRKQTAVGAWILLSVDKRWGRIIFKSKKNDTIVRTCHMYLFFQGMGILQHTCTLCNYIQKRCVFLTNNDLNSYLCWSLIISLEMVTKKRKIHKILSKGISSSGKGKPSHIYTILSPSQPEIVGQSRSCDPVTSRPINRLVIILQNMRCSGYTRQRILQDGWKL